MCPESFPISIFAIRFSWAREEELLFWWDSRPMDGPVESLVPKLHERANSLQNQLRGRYPAVKLELTGETPLNFDIRKASADDVQHAERSRDSRDACTSAGGFRKRGGGPDSNSRWPACHRRPLWRLQDSWRCTGTCPFWFRICPRCLGWAWESTTRSSWSAASGKRLPPSKTDSKPRPSRRVRRAVHS